MTQRRPRRRQHRDEEKGGKETERPTSASLPSGLENPLPNPQDPLLFPVCGNPKTSPLRLSPKIEHPITQEGRGSTVPTPHSPPGTAAPR